jgi:methylmalonyl-CoA mutase N-terminal domain/subunit
LEELAFTLANGFEYVRWAQDRGLDIDEFGARLSFFFNSHMDFFEEVAKFRAARRIWARHMKDEFGATNEDAMKLRFHTQTAGVSLTEQQPMNNVVRTAYEALAAVLGGTQSLHTNSYDEALALPSEKAVKIALRTQQIIAEETNVTDTIDPLAGSYYVESLTDEMEEKAEEYFDEIESRGGVIECIREGYFQNEISQSAYEHQKKVEDGERIIVGVNKYREENEDDHDILKIGEDVEERQKERLQRYKSERSSRAVDEAIDDLKHAAEAYENLMYPIINAADAGVTLGETVDCLKDVYGTWEEVPSF